MKDPSNVGLELECCQMKDPSNVRGVGIGIQIKVYDKTIVYIIDGAGVVLTNLRCVNLVCCVNFCV